MSSYEFPKPLDYELNCAESGYAIVCDGDTAPKAISSGQYLFIKNHSTLATGGYHATAAIASGADLTSSNTAPDADGIANALNSNISAFGDYDVLFELAQNDTSHTVPNVNQYRYILVCMLWLNDQSKVALLVSHTLPLGLFKALTTNGNGVQVETHDSSRHFVHLFLDSDTSMSLDTGSGITSNYVFSVYGIK